MWEADFELSVADDRYSVRCQVWMDTHPVSVGLGGGGGGWTPTRFLRTYFTRASLKAFIESQCRHAEQSTLMMF